jgi:predicted  nucleic acid-binding Zn-ribbon protein
VCDYKSLKHFAYNRHFRRSFEESNRVRAELEQLIALQKTDSQITQLQSNIAVIPERRAEIEKEFDQRAFEIRALEQQRDDAHHERVRLEVEAAETKTLAERAERNLMSSKKQDEYTAAIREADAARKHISKLEEQILENMETYDQAVAALKEREPEMEKLRIELEERIKAFEQQTSTQEAELARAREQRDHIVAALPKPIAAMYSRISTRIRGGVAVAEARNSSCSACFMALRPQVMSQIRRGDEVITCENCNRILFYVPADTQRSEQKPSPSVVAS